MIEEMEPHYSTNSIDFFKNKNPIWLGLFQLKWEFKNVAIII